jgi:hypothetical protein
MRGLVAVVLAMLAAGCYDPDVRDCAIRCDEKHTDHCAEGQVCDRDGWCTAPETAGRCNQGREADVDAGPR